MVFGEFLDTKQIEQIAIKLIPQITEKLFHNIDTSRTRILLSSREFDPNMRKIQTEEVIQQAIVRVIAAEAINQAGIKKFGKSKEYNQAKLVVRSAVITHLISPKIKPLFDKAINKRKQGLFSKVKKRLRQLKRK